MQKKSLQTINKKCISIMMIIIIVLTLVNALLITKTYAVNQVRNVDNNNIYNIDETIYPGYATLLQNLKSTHPNWTFTLLYTDLEWTDVLMNETIANHERSLVQGKTGEWLCTYNGCDGVPHDGSSWFGASQTAVAYYMDPRNFLTEDRIFQFEALSYVPSIHTESGVEAVLKGSFMYNTKICDYYGNSAYGDKTFAQTIMYAAQVSGVSPYHIASRIRQEVGANGSGSITGNVAGYEGYFNFYNIGAYASTDPIINGLIYAKRENVNWNTPEKSIVGGAQWIATSYIAKGQDSLYLQKWDVDNQYLGLYGHQYMTNIQAPTSEASTVYSSYKTIFNNELSSTSFNFIIPMYKNISKIVSRYPSSSTYVSQNAQLNDNYVYIRQTPNGTPIGLYNAGYSFLRIELKASKENGTNWDKIMLPDGTIGYVATQFVMEKIGRDEVSKKAYANINTNLLNGPRLVENGTTSIRLLYQGQSLTIIEEGKYTFDGCEWYKVRLTDGTEGYIQKNYITEGSFGEDVKVTCNTELALRSDPAGAIIKYINPGVIVTRIEKATNKVGDYYWDKVVTSDGIIGYMARERYNPYALWLTPVNGEEQPENPEDKFAVNETEKIIKTIPTAVFADIQQKYEGAILVSGTESLGTGAIIKISDMEYTIVKLGDVNGDGEIDVIDLALLKRHLVGTSFLKNEYYKAGMLQSEAQEIDVVDLALLKRHLTQTQYITLN